MDEDDLGDVDTKYLILRRLHDRQLLRWLAELQIGNLSHAERAWFGDMMHEAFRRKEEVDKWRTRTAIVVGLAAALGGTVPIIVQAIVHAHP